jgi:hypothetical protein
MAVDSYRQGKVLYFDDESWKVMDQLPQRMKEA